MLLALELGHERSDAPRRRRGKRLEHFARHRKFLRIHCSARHSKRGFDVARGGLRGKRLNAGKALTG
jgi:hypothetical protein